ncbi:fatty acid desaturase [Aquabacterium sp. A7-Y]|uniref:fatty acid desaturase n=1 Tax=Aquabacterium sp. A7-Y TaxID=1349605 RepID=UPI00223CBD4A|nr:fatty acid desaturase [Aquabacterium sp. A7-Y]MCW7541930.1 fatty acid desaturase [Aquabacterium sp. A7-Y]
MPRPTFPRAPDARFEALTRRVRSLDGVRLAEAIPPACFEPQPWRGLLGFALSYALYGLALAGVAHAPHWLYWPPLYVLAGLGGWGLHCIAHDCGHQSFSRSRLLNTVVGQAALLPLLYPYHAWRHVHHLHHRHTNHLELDTDWRPVSAEVHARMPPLDRALYSATRSWAFWAGTMRYWWVCTFRPGFFPERAMRREVRRSTLVVGLAGGLCLALLLRLAGPRGLLLYGVLPWVSIHAWFSATTLMHHVRSDLPFLSSAYWTPNAGRLLLTTDYRYPWLLELLTHHISLHTAHHVAPAVPFYHLPRAQAALMQAFPGMVTQRRFSFGELLEVLRFCRFFDPERGYYAASPLNVDRAAAKADLSSGGPR